MASAESPEDGSNHNDKAVDAPGWAAATGEHQPPLTDVQREVVDKVAEAQRELGRAEKWRKASRWDLLGGLFGGLFGGLASKLDSLRASNAEMRATDAEREALFLATSTDPGPDAEPQPHVPAGGPPTREEIYEAEMHPWPHHGMAETIEHNRGLREDPGGSEPRSDSRDANAEQ